MNIVIACDSFKDSLSATKVCNALALGIASTNAGVKIVQMPLADGGEGTIEALQHNLESQLITIDSFDALGRPVKASYLWIEKTQTAIIEMAQASGLEHIKITERDPLYSNTWGTGLLVKHALTKNPYEILLFVGGSATNDAGIGMAGALGFFFLDKNQQVLEPIGANLIHIDSIKYLENQDFKSIKFTVATDVINPFFGKNGAAHVFAKQKGATDDQIELLDKGLENINEVFKNQKNIDVQTIPGSGAAGGIAGGAAFFLNANIISAADWILKTCKVDSLLEAAQVVITGEGRIDSQTWQGKLISRLNIKAKEHNCKIILVGGSIKDINKITELDNLLLVTSIINEPMELSTALANTAKLLEDQGKIIGNLLRNISL